MNFNRCLSDLESDWFDGEPFGECHRTASRWIPWTAVSGVPVKACCIIQLLERLLTPGRSLQSAVDFLSGKMEGEI